MSKKRRRNNNQPLDVDSPAANHPLKRAKTYDNQDAHLADILNSLGSELQDVRTAATKELLGIIEPSREPSNAFIERVSSRLIRGLCSSRKASRLGFVVTLTEVLNQLFVSSDGRYPQLEIGVDQITDMIARFTAAEGAAAGQERRDHLYGRLFAYKALLQSGVLLQQDAPPAAWSKLSETICSLAQDVSWLRKECGTFLCEAVKLLRRKEASGEYLQQLIHCAMTHRLLKTVEGVAFWLTVRQQFPNHELPKGVWRKDDPFSEKVREELCQVMRGSVPSEEKNSAEQQTAAPVKHGSSQVMLNPAWTTVVDLGLEVAAESHRKPLKWFSSLWADIVDNNLFRATSSLERKSWGLQLFSKTILTSPEWAIPAIFSPNFMACLTNQCSNKERYLHKVAKTCLRNVCERASQNPKCSSTILEQLLSHDILFDRHTKSKTVQSLLQVADETFPAVIRTFFRHPRTEDIKAAETGRSALADYLLSYIKTRLSKADDSRQVIENIGSAGSWLTMTIDTFMELAYFSRPDQKQDSPKPEPDISERSLEMVRSKLTAALAYLQYSKLDDGAVVLAYVVNVIGKRQRNQEQRDVLPEAEEEVLETLDSAHQKLSDITAKERTTEKMVHAFVVMYRLALLQVYNGDTDAIAMLDELQTCYDVVIEDPTEGRLIIEIILSFVSRPSTLFKQLAEQAFAALTCDLRLTSLTALTEVLEGKEGSAEAEELFDDANAMAAEEADDANTDSDEEGEEEDDDSELEQSEVSQSDGGEDEEQLEKFDALLAQALGTSGFNRDADGSQSSDEDLDDDAMIALEPHLTKIFRERQAITDQKQQKKEAKTAVINLKSRVLDLLLILAKEQPSDPVCLSMIIPCLRLIRTTSAKHLADKAADLLRQYTNLAKVKGLPRMRDTEPLQRLIIQIGDEVMEKGPKNYVAACSRAGIFASRVLVGMGEEYVQTVAQSYGDIWTRWFRAEKAPVDQSFFSDWIGWHNARKQSSLAIQTRQL